MNALIRLHKVTLVLSLTLACFTVLQRARAVSPPPDGGYPRNNTAEGDNALESLTTGSGNTAIGFQTLFNNTTGNGNTANGINALFNNRTGGNNTANGNTALFSNTTGFNNTAIGNTAPATQLETATRLLELTRSDSTPLGRATQPTGILRCLVI